MKFPSLQTFVNSIRSVLQRFPLEIGFALLGTIAASVFIEISDLNLAAESLCMRLILISNLGLVLSLSFSLFSESHSHSVLKKNLFRVLLIIILVGLFFLIDPLKRETDFFRFILLALAAHLSVSFAPYFGKSHINAFWQFNRIIFLRFLIGGIYSAALFLGLAAAVGSMNFLFNFNFEWDTFALLWVLIVGIFQTVFFLSGVPENLDRIEEDKSYPAGLKIFTQFVLIPLATVYAVILLAYEAKILIELELPKGLVSNLILGYAVFGILSLLLIYPIRNQDENKWLKTFSRSFYYVLIPLIILLLWAVLARVIDYGITEERYFLIILAAWLAFINAYFLLSKSQNIMIIPFSLCLLTILSVYGPQGAFSTSKRSQINELKLLFQKHQALERDKIITLKVMPEKADMTRMINIVDYLVSMHGLESFSPILKRDPAMVVDSLLSVQKKKKYNSRTSNWEITSSQKLWLYTYLKLQPDEKNTSALNLGMNTVEALNAELLPLNKADYMLPFSIPSDTLSNIIDARKLLISRVANQNKLKVIYGSEEKYIILDTLINQLDIELKKQKSADKQALQVSRQLLSQSFEFGGLKLNIVWNQIIFNDNKDIISANGYILLNVKD
ncbi:MAG: DUF4153 domain-containing protein [Sphingobacterium thalpophilum]